jgi:hypothetical protein
VTPPIWGAHPGMDVEQLAGAYAVSGVIDYGPGRDGNGILFGIGAGLMMAAMDTVPTCRWAIDVSGGKAGPSYHVAQWCAALPWVVSHVAVAAWFSISSPDGFVRTMLHPVPCEIVAAYSHPALGYGVDCADLDELAIASAQLEHEAVLRHAARLA